MKAAITATPRTGTRAPSRIAVASQTSPSRKRRLMAATPAASMVVLSRRRSRRTYPQMTLNKTARSANAALAVGFGAVAAPSADAAAGCWTNDGGIKWYCNNVSGAPVYGIIGNNHSYPDPGKIVGYMYSNPSWFYCKEDG